MKRHLDTFSQNGYGLCIDVQRWGGSWGQKLVSCGCILPRTPAFGELGTHQCLSIFGANCDDFWIIFGIMAWVMNLWSLSCPMPLHIYIHTYICMYVHTLRRSINVEAPFIRRGGGLLSVEGGLLSVEGFEFEWIFMNFNDFRQISMNFDGFFKNFNGFSRFIYSMNFNEFHWILMDFMNFTGFSWIFTEFHWILMDFMNFNWFSWISMDCQWIFNKFWWIFHEFQWIFINFPLNFQ